MAYEVTVSITALCPSCGKALPDSAYLTESRPTHAPFDYDNPCERRERRVFISPCGDCYEYKRREESP